MSEQRIDILRDRVAELEAALRKIADWTMHHGIKAYAQQTNYSELYYMIEKEVNEARDIARDALAQSAERAKL